MRERAICNSVSDCAKPLGSVCNRIDLRWNVIVSLSLHMIHIYKYKAGGIDYLKKRLVALTELPNIVF